MLGAPGAGKGTVAKLRTDYDGSVHYLKMGDILRPPSVRHKWIGQ
jgi:adenylate kinase